MPLIKGNDPLVDKSPKLHKKHLELHLIMQAEKEQKIGSSASLKKETTKYMGTYWISRYMPQMWGEMIGQFQDKW